jgi:SAM-dependent methyltransferase
MTASTTPFPTVEIGLGSKGYPMSRQLWQEVFISPPVGPRAVMAWDFDRVMEKTHHSRFADHPDRVRWNGKFKARSSELGQPPAFIVSQLEKLPKGRVLDLACGDGRISIALAQRGFKVMGVDISDAGLLRLEAFAEKARVQVDTAQRDLQASDALGGLGPADGVVMCNYKPAALLWPQVAEILNPGGWVMLCTFNRLQEKKGGPSRRFLLDDGEFKSVHPRLKLEKYQRFEEGGHHLDGYLWRANQS